MTRVQLSRFTVVLLVVLSLFAVSCRKPAPPPPPVAATPTPPPPPPPAPVITLRSDRATIDRGQGVMLTWDARNAATVQIEPGIGNVGTAGTQQVSPAASITYTATATGPGGTATDNARITVNAPPPPAAAPPARPAPTVDIAELFRQNVQPVLFDYDQADIRGDQISRLQSNTAWFKQNPNVRFTVEGHADDRGSQEYNVGLGDRRANAVKQYLVTQGIPEARMNVVSFGEERPECRETTEACYARNRRVAFALNQ